MTASPGPRPPDLLVSGDDRPPRRLAPRSRRAAVATVVAVGVAGATTAVGLEVRADRVERELRPGRSVVLGRTPPTACGAAQPRVLHVRALAPSGGPATVEIGLAGAQLADGGRLEDVMTATALDCDQTAAPQDDGRIYPHRS